MTATVVLHVGAMKTGTTFIQAVMGTNRAALAERGVLWPGHSWAEQVRAVNDVKSRRTSAPARDGDGWDRLVAEIGSWDGHLAIVSMEALAGSTPQTISTVVESLAPHRVRVVVTLRDLGRTVPAQWQESVQNGHSWTYRSYLAGVTSKRHKNSDAGTHFWKRQNWGRIIARWGAAVGHENVFVVTVPPPGSPRTLLWQRFSQAAVLDPAYYETKVDSNESIGATSAELMRLINARVGRDADSSGDVTLKRVLAKGIFATHKSNEPSLVLPEADRPWAIRQSQRLAHAVSDEAPEIVGDLNDLIPRFGLPRGPVTDDPGALQPDQLLDTALFGLLGLAKVVANG